MARRHAWGINGEPLQWEPPASWVTATAWPGADPAGADPGPVHQALLTGDMPVTRVASSLRISADHMRQILRHHRCPCPCGRSGGASTPAASGPPRTPPRTPMPSASNWTGCASST